MKQVGLRIGDQGPFDGANVRLPRFALNLSLAELGDQVGVSKQFLHRVEVGHDLPNSELITSLARALEVEERFFFQQNEQPLPLEAYHFRKLARTKAADRQCAIAQGELFRRVVREIDSRLKLPKLNFLSFDISSPEMAERAAEKLRAHWGLGTGPISNMVRVLENAGAMVTEFGVATREIDALCIASTRPIVVSNATQASNCRIRFDHAHELAHFIGHQGRVTGDQATEAEANRFASAFLMPRASFSKEFPALRGGSQINWVALSELKGRWRVSKAAMLYRARQLQILSDDQYRRALLGHLYARGERFLEKDDHLVSPEHPELLDNALETLESALKLGLGEIAKILGVRRELLERIIPPHRAVAAPNPRAEVFLLERYRFRK